MRRRDDALIGVMLAAALAGCWGCSSATSQSANPAGTSVVLAVENQTFYDATIEIIGPSGLRRRLGVVSANATKEFSFDWPDLSVQVEARLLAGGVHVTQPLTVTPGDVLDLRLQPNLFRR